MPKGLITNPRVLALNAIRALFVLDLVVLGLEIVLIAGLIWQMTGHGNLGIRWSYPAATLSYFLIGLLLKKKLSDFLQVN